MNWDNTAITVDDHTLLRAIAMEEGKIAPRADTASAVKKVVVDSPNFQVVRENEHLRNLLAEYLRANIAVTQKTKEIQVESSRNAIRKLFGGKVLKGLQDELAILKAIRDEAFKPYEMLRKLTDIDNVLLIRVKS